MIQDSMLSLIFAMNRDMMSDINIAHKILYTSG